MMLYPAMNKLTANVPNRYLLVNVVARRARQIAQQAEDAGAHQFELDAIKMRFSSAFDLAKQENFEKQRSILRVLTQIRDNLTMAVGAESGFDDRRRRRRTRRRTI